MLKASAGNPTAEEIHRACATGTIKDTVAEIDESAVKISDVVGKWPNDSTRNSDIQRATAGAKHSVRILSSSDRLKRDE